MNSFIFSAIIEGVATRVDKTLKITLGSNELSPEGYANLFKLNQKFVGVLINEEGIDDKDVRELDEKMFDEFDKRQTKTPSQRLRNVFYLLWEQNKGGYEDFKDYYAKKMEGVIEYYKAKIDG